METIVKKRKGRLNLIQKWLSRSTPRAKGALSKEDKHEKPNGSPEYIKTETKNAYLIAIKLPHVDRNSIVVKRTKPEKLQVTGKNRKEIGQADSTGEEYNKYEGMFYLTFDIKPNSDIQRIDANFKNDILTIRIPKLTKVEPAGFQIKVE